MEKYCEYCKNKIPNVQRSTRKYCNDNCKQLAYYQRHGIVGITNNLPAIINKEINSELPFSVKQDFTVKDKQEENAELSEEENHTEDLIQSAEEMDSEKEKTEKQTVNPDTVKAKYQFIDSAFLLYIIQYDENGKKADRFYRPNQYWNEQEQYQVRWVTLRLRCLLENIIRLSNYRYIDREALFAIANAFRKLKDSVYFKNIKSNYPFTQLLNELASTFNAMAKNNVRNKNIHFKLSSKRKAEFMAVRFMVSNFVPKERFRNLDFSDGIKESIRKEQIKFSH